MKNICHPSILSLIILTASFLITILLPGNLNDSLLTNSFDNGTLRSISGIGDAQNNPVISCVGDNTLNLSCHISVNATQTGAASDQFPQIVTANNTSNSNPFDGFDTTSRF